MDFGHWLVHMGWMTREEYRSILKEQLNRIFSPHKGNNSLQNPPLPLLSDYSKLRAAPFGKLLEEMQDILNEVLQRSQKTEIPELIDEWYAWHRDHLEPICDYCLSNHLGAELYVREEDKKRVARFLVDAKLPAKGKIIQENDTVVLFEGTSALYVGLAIASSYRNITVTTSNTGMVGEYRNNPAVQKRLKELNIIGGKADEFYCEVDGNPAKTQYIEAVSGNRETILVVPFTRFTAEYGPTARGPAAAMRGDIVETSFQQSQLREVVFVGDYTKLVESTLGRTIFKNGDWPKIVEKHKDRMSIVVSPPPNILAAYDIAQVWGITDQLDVSTRNLSKLQEEAPFQNILTFTQEDLDYDRVVKNLRSLRISVYEAVDLNRFNTQRIVLRFSSAEEIVNRGCFSTLLHSFLTKDEFAQLLIVEDQQQNQAEAVFDIRGPAELLFRIHQRELTQSTLQEAFGDNCSLTSVTVEGDFASSTWQFNSSETPVSLAKLSEAAGVSHT